MMSTKHPIPFDPSQLNIPPNMCRDVDHQQQNIMSRPPMNFHLTNLTPVVHPPTMNMHFAAQTKEEEKLAREAKAAAMQQRRMLLSDEQKKRIRESNAEAMRLRRSAQTEDEKQLARAAKAAAMQLQRSLLNEEQRQRIRDSNAAAMRIRRSTLSEDEKQIIRDSNAAAMRIRRASQTEEERQIARKANAAAMRLRRSYLSLGKKPPCKSDNRFDVNDGIKQEMHYNSGVPPIQPSQVKEEYRYGEHISDADFRFYRNMFGDSQKPPPMEPTPPPKSNRSGKRKTHNRVLSPKAIHTPSFLHDQRTLYESSILSLCQTNGFGYKPEHRHQPTIPHAPLMYH